MDIQDLRKRKKKLESDIEKSISSLLIKFQTETKFSPDYINVNLVEVTTIGEENKVYVVGNVTTNIEL
jgi:hypothetical protein